MSEKHKIDIDELLTLTLDGEATQRQQTELKRLMLHDPSIDEKLKALQQQQRLLQLLPVESAPESLIDDIRAELERKLILGDSGETAATVSGSSHLLVRRVLTTAAMLLIPLGLLSAVVWQIMKPAQGTIDYVPANHRIAEATGDGSVPFAAADPGGFLKELPFNGALVLKTDEYMTVSNQVEKAILAQGLLGHTLPSRTADITSFHITAPPKMIAALMDSLIPVRPRCKQVVLNVVRDGETVKITDPQGRQIKTLVFEDNPDMLNRLAVRYAAANLKGDTALAKGDDGKTTPALTADGYPAPSIPTLAGSYEQLNNATIQLSIHVERSLK